MSRPVRVARTGAQSSLGAAIAVILAHLIGWEDPELVAALIVVVTTIVTTVQHLLEAKIGRSVPGSTEADHDRTIALTADESVLERITKTNNSRKDGDTV